MAIDVNIKGGTVQLSGNPIEIECSGGAAPTGSTGYVILLRVISTDGNLFGAPFEDAKAIDDSGKATFKIQAYADQPIKKKFQYPVTSGLCRIRCTAVSSASSSRRILAGF